MRDSDDDAALVAAARTGDRDALDRLLRRYYDRVHAVCRRIAGAGRDADDAAQEAMIGIVRGLGRFDGRSAFSTWVYRVATNAALDELRRRRRRPTLHAVGDDAPWPEIADPLAERRVDAAALRLVIDDALDDLPEEFRAPVVLRDVADLDYAEIAEVLSIPLGTVKSRIARGRSQLAEALGNHGSSSGRQTPPTP
jgi:RNA polymerase sigma-70 factor, ECF subfamily